MPPINKKQKYFDNKKVDSLTKDLNLICVKNSLIRCKGRLKNVLLPYDTKTVSHFNITRSDRNKTKILDIERNRFCQENLKKIYHLKKIQS